MHAHVRLLLLSTVPLSSDSANKSLYPRLFQHALATAMLAIHPPLTNELSYTLVPD